MELLVAQGSRSLPELYFALIQTNNKHLADLMVKYVQAFETQITKRINQRE